MTEIQVMADNNQWQAEMDVVVDIQGVQDLSLYVHCSSGVPVNSPNDAHDANGANGALRRKRGFCT